MEREISSGATLGIVLLALAAVIGLGFGVFAIAKGIANEGTVNVQDSLGTVSMQVFLDFDQKVITGTQAASALKTFEGKPYAVLISTKALMGGQAVATAADHPTVYLVADGTAASANKYINYNAVLALNNAGAATASLASTATTRTATSVSATGMTQISLSNGVFNLTNGFALSGGNILFDNSIGGISKSGNAEYIPTNTKFQANLLKDASGAIMGIVLRQL